MEQQPGNNFDALFQKAAEDYPLKTDNSNWNIVAAKLSKTEASSPANKSRWWQYAAILLLLLSAGSYLYFSDKAGNDNQAAGNKYKKIITSSAKPLKNNSKQYKATISAENFQHQSKEDFATGSSAKVSGNNLITNNNSGLLKQSYRQQNSIISNSSINIQSTDLNSNNFSKESQNFASASQSLQAVTNTTTENKANNLADNKVLNQVNKESVEDKQNKNSKPAESKSTESQHIKLQQQPKLLYGELFFSPDFSTVKLQNVNAPGYNVGIALGYKISKRFSVELGLERLHTDFYSNAKYLDKSHLRLKPNTTVQFVNGKSKLTEVPFDIKYNLSKNNDHFFVTLGTTVARITHTEKYNYRVIKDGTQHEASKNFGALTGTKFFSDVNLSAGYQTKISGSFSLKAEPYYQIPLKGIGVGNLPVTNFGVSIGIIKDLK